MVGKVLTGNGITRCERGTYALVGGEELSDAERDQLLELCRQRLDAFREQRGEEVFAHRSRHRTPISGSIKYRVLTRARGRCECCGAHEHQRALEVDHIVPKNQGGSDDLSNLQALCFRCNAGKRDTDTTDFRGLQASYAQREAGCVFCALEGSGRVLLENELALCIADAYPVTPGPQSGDPPAPCGRWVGAAPAGVERRGGAAEAAGGAAERSGRNDQRLECGVEFRRGGGADGVSCALASDSAAGGGLR
jgi:ATP adenylyltransferase